MTAPTYRVLDPSTFDPVEVARRDFADHVLVGLSEPRKSLSSRYFYDDVGSGLFQKITDLDEYYPTRCEFEILHSRSREILSRYRGKAVNIVDLGAGDGRKTAVLLGHALELGLDVRYVPVDISEAAIAGVVKSMAERFPGLPIEGLVSEYGDGIRWLGAQGGRSNLVLFLGSNVGNFSMPGARGFLQRLGSALGRGDHVLVGFDLKKDIDVLLAAYNDREGVTARFNLNLLTRINRELGADFDVQAFRHYATYDVFSGAIESYLVSREAQTVRIEALGDRFEFAPWEPIHTEYSYKYLETDIDALCQHAGFVSEGRYHDAQGWFCDALWRVVR